jgi:hypothetical protein
MKERSIRTTIAPWLTVQNGEEAAVFIRLHLMLLKHIA